MKKSFEFPRIAVWDPSAYLTKLGSSVLRFNALGAIKVDLRKAADEVVSMSHAGWFLDMKMGVTKPRKFKAHIDSGNAGAAESMMIEHFSGRVQGIRTELSNAFPARKAIFDAAFDAHVSGQYLLSVPVFLTQVDGICTDAMRLAFFLRGQRDKVVKQLKGRAGSDLALAYLSPLDTEMTVAMSESSRPPDFNGLNRHIVLHGESVTYGTLSNSLRAISLLNFIAQAIERDPPKAECDPEHK